jgi:hypothetical protein
MIGLSNLDPSGTTRFNAAFGYGVLDYPPLPLGYVAAVKTGEITHGIWLPFITPKVMSDYIETMAVINFLAPVDGFFRGSKTAVRFLKHYADNTGTKEFLTIDEMRQMAKESKAFAALVKSAAFSAQHAAISLWANRGNGVYVVSVASQLWDSLEITPAESRNFNLALGGINVAFKGVALNDNNRCCRMSLLVKVIDYYDFSLLSSKTIKVYGNTILSDHDLAKFHY